MSQLCVSLSFSIKLHVCVCVFNIVKTFEEALKFSTDFFLEKVKPEDSWV